MFSADTWILEFVCSTLAPPGREFPCYTPRLTAPHLETTGSLNKCVTVHTHPSQTYILLHEVKAAAESLRGQRHLGEELQPHWELTGKHRYALADPPAQWKPFYSPEHHAPAELSLPKVWCQTWICVISSQSSVDFWLHHLMDVLLLGFGASVQFSRLVLSCLRLVHGHRQLKQVWNAGNAQEWGGRWRWREEEHHQPALLHVQTGQAGQVSLHF